MSLLGQLIRFYFSIFLTKSQYMCVNTTVRINLLTLVWVILYSGWSIFMEVDMKEMDKIDLIFLMKDVLKVLTNHIDENAFVGDECPSNWDQGRRPTSIDLFFYIEENKTFEEVKELLELHFVESGFEIHFTGEGESNGKFNNIPSIERVINATMDGWCLQFVQLGVNTNTLIMKKCF